MLLLCLYFSLAYAYEFPWAGDREQLQLSPESLCTWEGAGGTYLLLLERTGLQKPFGFR